MPELVLVAALAAGLAGVSTVAADRWGHEIGGILSAFPVIVGPVLLLGAHNHGARFAADAAAATLAGLAALSAFALAYSHAALRWGWAAALGTGWCAAAAAGTLAGRAELGLALAAAAAAASIAAARAGLPAAAQARPSLPLPAWELPLRMGATALLIVLITLAGNRFGPTVAGVLAALPTLASVLAVFTHARHGPDAALRLLRGTLGGMVAFAAFCVVVGLLVDRAGLAATFALATLAAAVIQLMALGSPSRWTSTSS
jgi:uncharacterized membrane protein (GlpM family)